MDAIAGQVDDRGFHDAGLPVAKLLRRNRAHEVAAVVGARHGAGNIDALRRLALTLMAQGYGAAWHAATMVAAGVFLVARLDPLYGLFPSIQAVIAVVGTITCFLGATIALTQMDLKKGLAYSTVSQLGYMMLQRPAYP